MKKIALITLAVMIISPALAQDLPVIKINHLENLLKTNDEKKIIVVNFWATWCGPCVSELPIFETLHNQSDPNVAVYLINLDFADKIGRVKSFIKRKNITASVLLLDEPDYNSWIDRIEPSWSGAIPATIILNAETGKRKFVEKELSELELKQMISEVKNP